jgi:hypothetical protein
MACARRSSRALSWGTWARPALPLWHLQEYRFTAVDAFEPGQELHFTELFKEGDLVDVSDNSIGKGFQGTTHICNAYYSLPVASLAFSLETDEVSNTGNATCSDYIHDWFVTVMIMRAVNEVKIVCFAMPPLPRQLGSSIMLI